MHEDCALRQVVVISHNVRDEAELLPADILDQMHVANGYRARALLLVDGSQSHIRVAPRNILFETRDDDLHISLGHLSVQSGGHQALSGTAGWVQANRTGPPLATPAHREQMPAVGYRTIAEARRAF